MPDGSGFFTARSTRRYPGKEYLETNTASRLRLHLHRDRRRADDTVFYADPNPKREPDAQRSTRAAGWSSRPNEGNTRESTVMVIDLTPGSTDPRLIPTPEWDSRVVGNDGSTFFVLTDADAPMKRVVAIDLDNPAPDHWREVISEGADAILDATQVGDRLVTHSLHDASSRLQIWSTAGERLGEVELPPYVTVHRAVGR